MSRTTALGCLPHVLPRRRCRPGHLSPSKREDSGTAASTVATLCCDISPLSCSSSPPLGIVEACLNCTEVAESFSPERKQLFQVASTPAANHEDNCFPLSTYSGVLPEIDDRHRGTGSSSSSLGRRCNTKAKPSAFIKNSLKKIVRRKRASCLASFTGDGIPMYWASESAMTSAKLSAARHNDKTAPEKGDGEAFKKAFLPRSEVVLSRHAPPVTPCSLKDPAKGKYPCPSSSLSLVIRYFSSPRRRRNASSLGVLEGRNEEDGENSTVSSPLHAEEVDQELEKMGAPLLGDEDCILRSDLTRFIDCRTLQMMNEDDEQTTQL